LTDFREKNENIEFYGNLSSGSSWAGGQAGGRAGRQTGRWAGGQADGRAGVQEARGEGGRAGIVAACCHNALLVQRS